MQFSIQVPELGRLASNSAYRGLAALLAAL